MIPSTLLAESPSPSSRPPSSRPDAEAHHGPRHIRKRQSCARFLDVDLAHRLVNHPSKCKNLHGHRMRIEVTCSTMGVDHLGVILDFSEIKRLIGGWLEALAQNYVAAASFDWVAHLQQVGEEKAKRSADKEKRKAEQFKITIVGPNDLREATMRLIADFAAQNPAVKVKQ